MKINMQAIVAIANQRIIGYQGKIPWHLPEDFKWFKQTTMGGSLIMGRKTFESIGKALPGRTTIILTRNTLRLHDPNIKQYHSVEELLEKEKDNQSLWVCGGEEVYKQLLPYCTSLYITSVKQPVAAGDTYFPDFESNFAKGEVLLETPDFIVEKWNQVSISNRFVFPTTNFDPIIVEAHMGTVAFKQGEFTIYVNKKEWNEFMHSLSWFKISNTK